MWLQAADQTQFGVFFPHFCPAGCNWKRHLSSILLLSCFFTGSYGMNEAALVTRFHSSSDNITFRNVSRGVEARIHVAPHSSSRQQRPGWKFTPRRNKRQIVLCTFWPQRSFPTPQSRTFRPLSCCTEDTSCLLVAAIFLSLSSAGICFYLQSFFR